MDIGIVSSRYAKALLRFADENEEAKQVYQEMQQMVVSFTNLPMLTHALQNPTLSKEKKAMLLVAAAKTEQEVSISTKRFVELCISHRRENIMQFIATSYAAHYETANNILRWQLRNLLTIIHCIPYTRHHPLRHFFIWQCPHSTLRLSNSASLGIHSQGIQCVS